MDPSPTAPQCAGEDGVSVPLLMAKSCHRDLRTLSRYVRPGTEAVARLTAEFFAARLSNPHNRRPVENFLAWGEQQRIELRQVTPSLAGHFLPHYLTLSS